MGTKMAPAYANLFMAELEERLLENYPTQPILWKRYIDDVLCLWPGSQEDLDKFMDYLNKAHPTIKFTHECSQTSIDFLDITIYKGDRYKMQNKLDIKPFLKKNNKFQYLQYSSAHPKSTFTSLIKGEMTRLLRACSSESDYHKTRDKLYKVLRDRGYPNYLIKKVQEEVPYAHRCNVIKEKQSKPCSYDTFLVTEYTPDLDTKKLKRIIRPRPEEKEHIPKPCLSLKKSKTLGKSLVRAKLKKQPDLPISTDRIIITTTPNLNGHSASCGINACKCCPVMSKKIRAISTSNYKSFPTSKHANCMTKNVIYLLECTKCNKRNQKNLKENCTSLN